MAAKSTPSLIKALQKDNKSRMTGMTVQVKTNMFNTTHQVGASTTMNSDLDTQRLEKPAKNINISSHDDLSYLADEKPKKEKVRPKTTRAFGDRRMTEQPEMFKTSEIVIDQNA